VISDMDEPPVNVLPNDVQTVSTSESDRQGCPRIKHRQFWQYDDALSWCNRDQYSSVYWWNQNNLTKQVGINFFLCFTWHAMGQSH